MKELVTSSRNDYMTLNVYGDGNGGYTAESCILGETFNPEGTFPSIRDAQMAVFPEYRERLITAGLLKPSFHVID